METEEDERGKGEGSSSSHRLDLLAIEGFVKTMIWNFRSSCTNKFPLPVLLPPDDQADEGAAEGEEQFKAPPPMPFSSTLSSSPSASFSSPSSASSSTSSSMSHFWQPQEASKQDPILTKLGELYDLILEDLDQLCFKLLAAKIKP